MKNVTKKLLTTAMKGIPPMKRKLDVDISNPNDQERLLKVAVSLLDNNDSIDVEDIRAVCEEIGEEYSQILADETSFNESFAHTIYSGIDDMKNIIDLYRVIKNKEQTN